MLKEMAQDSAPSLNGFGVSFYNHCWKIIGNDLYKVVKEFFNVKVLPNSWKAIFLALIPKKTTLNSSLTSNLLTFVM